MGLDLDTVRGRIQPIGWDVYPVDVELDIRDVTMRRDFIAKHYGGNTQKTFPAIKPARAARTGKSHFMYPNLSYNPHCPEMPGAPGLFFDAYYPLQDNANGELDGSNATGVYTLIIRQDSHCWAYLGEYEKGEAPRLTTEEWKQQSRKVRDTWASKILQKGWGLSIVAGVGLRKRLGRRPTQHEANAAVKKMEVDRAAARARREKYVPNVTVTDISNALDRGEVRIAVSTLKCIGYDADFQKDLVAKKPFFVPPLRRQPAKKSSTNGGRKTASQGKRGGASASQGKKRKRGQSEEDNDSEDVVFSEDEGLPETSYRHQGTRSRPIVM
ncbi:hypothetical protein B0H11DRAFT_1305969 [Mycena galericulata]|nr:hypothetical protein B0H11DRAFT_1305969 [Mycena galericulata]